MLLLAIVLTLVASFLVAPSTVAAAPPAPQAQQPPPMTEAADVPSARSTSRLNGRPIEALSEHTESSNVSVNPDCTVTTELHAAPVRMKLGDTWVPIDLTLASAGDVVRANAHPRDLTLSAGGTDGQVEVAKIKQGDTEVALQWKGKLPAPELVGDTATYREVRPGGNLVIRATRTGFAPSLQGAKAEFSYRTKGIEQRADAAASLWDGPSVTSAADPGGRSLRVGVDKTSLRFDLGFLRGKRVLDAKVWLLATKAATCDKRRIELWDAGQQAATPAGSKEVGCESGWVGTDVSALAQRAALDLKTSAAAASSARHTALVYRG